MKYIAKMLLATTLLVGATLPVILSVSDAYAVNSTKEVKTQESNKQIIDKTVKLAAQGKVINSEQFGLGSKKQDILKKWGKPEYTDKYENHWEVLDYTKRGVRFLLVKGQVTEVTTEDKRVLALSHKDVEQALGKPIEQDHGAGQIYETYQSGKNLIQIHWTNVTEKKDGLELVDLTVVKK
jgi:outer membrane protein assembly factor BamE (lipoprotein component of BamABCDE complex)